MYLPYHNFNKVFGFPCLQRLSQNFVARSAIKQNAFLAPAKTFSNSALSQSVKGFPSNLNQKHISQRRLLLPDVEPLFGFASLYPALVSGTRTIKRLMVLNSALDTEVEKGGANGQWTTAQVLGKPIRKKKSQVETDSKRSFIIKLAKERGIPIVPVPRHQLDKLTEEAPHQGLVALASPLQPKLIRALGPVDSKSQSFDIELQNGSKVSGLASHPASIARPPLLVALEKIVDPHNLGAIIRTAYFLGAAGVIATLDESAGPTPTVSRTSAGALELSNFYQVHNLAKFLRQSRSHGWRNLGTGLSNSATPINKLNQPASPTILVLGNEGSGLSSNVMDQCDQLITIPGATTHSLEGSDGFVTSLNVSVAGAILMNHLLNPSTFS